MVERLDRSAHTSAVPLMDYWYRFAVWTLERTEKFPKSARFTVSSRIDNLVLDGIGQIIEARYGRDRSGNLLLFNMQMEKLRFLFRLSYERRYLSSAMYQFAAEQIDTAGKMAGGWIKSRVKVEESSS